MVYASNNELSSMVEYDGATTFTYYDWGRQITKAFGSDSAVYSYGYGSKLTKVASTLPGEGAVDYRYGGDGKRRERDGGGSDHTCRMWNDQTALHTTLSGLGRGLGFLVS